MGGDEGFVLVNVKQGIRFKQRRAATRNPSMFGGATGTRGLGYPHIDETTALLILRQSFSVPPFCNDAETVHPDTIRFQSIPRCVPRPPAVNGPRLQEKSGQVRSDNRQEAVRSERTYVALPAQPKKAQPIVALRSCKSSLPGRSLPRLSGCCNAAAARAAAGSAAATAASAAAAAAAAACLSYFCVLIELFEGAPSAYT